MKLCTGCGNEKALSDFHKKGSGKLGVAFFCKICTVAKRAEYRKTNPEQVARSKKKWAQNNPDKTRASTVRWRNRNPDEASSRDKIYQFRYANRYPGWIQGLAKLRYYANHGKMLEKRKRREAVKLKAMPRWTNKAELQEVYDKACALRKNGIDVHVDHIVPLRNINVCGLHCPNNLQLTSPILNLRKGNIYG